ncbi:GNAT family N-acetyltransferase [Candidatus Woesearchaeota archaeon]|nr:GNAT family N-acetyltransferase [Candidatus Woesearchaeota archaeon]
MKMAEIRIADSQGIKQLMPLQYGLFKKEQEKDKFYSVNEFWFFTVDHKSHLIYLTENPNNCIFIAVDDKKIVGYIAVQIKQRQPFMERVAEISELYVEPEYRKAEFGINLFENSLEWVKAKGAKWMTLSIFHLDKAQINFWKKKGFEEIDKMFAKKIL